MSGIAQLGINLPTLIAQVIAFVILFGLLKLFAFKPILKMLDARSLKIKEAVEQAEAAKTQAAHAGEEIRKQLEAASREGQERIVRAAKVGDELKAKAQEEAARQAETIISRARAEIQRERDDAIGQLRGAFADLTVLAAGKVIDRSLDKKAHQELINKVLEESSTLKKG